MTERGAFAQRSTDDEFLPDLVCSPNMEGMMEHVSDWRDKSDDELTSADFDEMRALAEPATTRASIPADGVFVVPVRTCGQVVRPRTLPFVMASEVLQTA